MNLLVMDAVSELDREWFEKHPGHRCYVRDLVPGELPEGAPTGHNVVLVVEMFRGARMRLPLKAYRDDDGPLKTLVSMATGERWNVAPNGAVTPGRGTRRPAWEAFASGESQALLEAGFIVARKRGEW